VVLHVLVAAFLAQTPASAVGEVMVRLRQGTVVRARAVSERGELLIIDAVDGTRWSVRRTEVVEVQTLASPRPPRSAASASSASRQVAARPRRRAGAMSVAGIAGVPAVAEDEPEDAPQRAPGHGDAATWRARARTTRARAASLERELAQLQGRKDEILGLEQTIVRQGGQPFVTADLMIVEIKLQTVRKDLDAARKAVADLEEEARRAGIPRGWVR